MSYGDQGYSEQGRGGFPIRWLIALVIAAIGVFSYWNHTEINPVTKERQHIGMSVDQEKALGLQAAPQMADKMGGALDPNSDPRARLVLDVGRQIVARSDASRSPYADNFHFYLLRDPKTINAFALPGGQIFITEALFDKLEDEAQLAGVLGHETGHVIERHSAQQMAKGQLGTMIATAVGVGATDERGRGQGTAMAAAMANQMLQLHYGRGDESQADEFGLKYMAQAGYDPRAMLAVMKILKEASQGERQPEFLSTHPLPETRLKEIEAKIKESYPNGIPGDLTEGRSLKGGVASTPGALERPERAAAEGERGGGKFDKVFRKGD